MALLPKPSSAELDDALARLGLEPDGTPFRSLSSLACRVTLDGKPAFLKVTHEPEELAGVGALETWGGRAAVRVLVHDGNAIVLERGGRTLRSSATDDSAATQVLCAVAHRLHTHHGPTDLDEFPTLRRWFSSLLDDTTPRFNRARAIADRLLNRPTRPVLLHGDLHHDNVLDTDRGWLAIDPKGIVGPAAFDYCDLFTNPTPQQATQHFDTRLHLVASTADLDPADLLRWIAAWAALSGIWHLEDGDQELASFPHSIMDLALDRLGSSSTSRPV